MTTTTSAEDQIMIYDPVGPWLNGQKKWVNSDNQSDSGDNNNTSVPNYQHSSNQSSSYSCPSLDAFNLLKAESDSHHDHYGQLQLQRLRPPKQYPRMLCCQMSESHAWPYITPPSFPSYLSTMATTMATMIRQITRHLSCYYYGCGSRRRIRRRRRPNPRYIVTTTNNSNNSGSVVVQSVNMLHILILFQLLFSISTTMINCFKHDLVEQIPTSLCDHRDQNADNALGMESGAIPDEAITASSTFNEPSVGPQNARLNRETNGGAWCPTNQINDKNSGHEWIQINLTQPHVIIKLATQGRFANGVGKEFAETFWLDYTRDGLEWTRWRSQDKKFEIPGNVDTYSIVENVLYPPLVGVTAIRLFPVSANIRTCCVRLELYGCQYKDGLVSYSMMDGQMNTRFGDLIDDTYDGNISVDGFLTGGLGQLVDGIRGVDDYKLNKGFEWIGWKQSHYGIVEIVMEFADIRNFTTVAFHCHNLFSKDVQVFHSAKIWFSLDGQRWSPAAQDFEYMPDLVLEKARDVVIYLHHRIGRFMKFNFHFASKWLLISEASFESEPISDGLSINDLMVETSWLEPTRTQSSGPSSSSSSSSSSRFIYNEPIVFIVFAAFGVLLVLFVVMFICLARKSKEKITGAEYSNVPMKDSSAPLYCEPHDFHSRTTLSPFGPMTDVLGGGLGVGGDPEYAVPDLIGNGTIGTRGTFLTSVQKGNLLTSLTLSHQPSSPFLNNKMNGVHNWAATNNNNVKSMKKNLNNVAAVADDDGDDGKARYYASADVLLRNNDLAQNNNLVVEASNQPINGLQTPSSGFFLVPRNTNNVPPLAAAFPIGNGVMQNSQYQTKHESPPSSLSSNNSKRLRLNNSSTHSTSLESYENTPQHSSSSTSKITNNGSTPSPGVVPGTQNHPVPLLRDKDVSIIEGHFGTSKFGDCELGYLAPRKNDKKKQLVILKTLVGKRSKFHEEFLQEMNEKYRLSNQCRDSFAQMFGYISKYDYLAMVIEYGDCDLKKFLRDNHASPSVVRTAELVEIACQVAEAMQDLHARGFIHRDLAARNCLIYVANLRVKITDSGAMINSYKNEYFNEALPIRWMSYESILQGIFSQKSDVFSFGVTLWEIMKHCQTLPHQPLSDEELLTEIMNNDNNSTKNYDSSSAYYNHPFSDGANHMNYKKPILRLPKPKDCPDEIDDLISECTQTCDDSRPNFTEIVFFLKKQTVGLRKN